MADSLLVPLHVKYIAALAKHRGSLAYHLTTHLRLNAIYWAATTLHLLGAPEALPRDGLVEFTLSCWDDDAGAFGPFPQHDAHILATLSGIQVLALNDALGELEKDGRKERLVKYICSLQDQDSGAFFGDSTRLEQDTRFLYCAVCALSLLSSLHSVSRERCVRAVLAARNHDGGFGTVPGSESHAGQAFVCVGALAILDALDELQGADGKGKDKLAGWLSERQLPCGGLNGRPRKLEDVCYSWWVLTALAILGKLHWISGTKLSQFIVSAQDPDHGGIADRPDNVADVFHTFFGVAGLAMLGGPPAQGLREVDPVFALPAHVTRRMGIQKPYQRLPDAPREEEAQ